jgi:molybdenum cofactor guanylyltransferase
MSASKKAIKLLPLILAGGKSSRMGAPKHLLRLPSGVSLYIHLMREIHKAIPESKHIFISLAADSDTDEVLKHGKPVQVDSAFGNDADRLDENLIQIEVIIDLDPVPLVPDQAKLASPASIGPAAGLLAAHYYSKEATWMVLACDYPLLTSTGLRQLIDSYESPVTCFQNADGFCEPLIGIWSPEALRLLESNVRKGNTGPAWTVREIGGNLVIPTPTEPTENVSNWLKNANTKKDWDDIVWILEHS